ncbi:uncharacterized protein [Clytia hemisphaerica]
MSGLFTSCLFCLLIVVFCLQNASANEPKQDVAKWKTGADGLVYLVNNHKLAWEDAKQFCEKRSGKLVVVPNEHVRESLKDLLRNQEDALYWTGLSEDLFKKWAWEEGGGATPFTDWAVGQPYDEDGVPGCGVVDVHAKWRVSHCETERRSVCQKADNGLDDEESEVTNSERLQAEQSGKRKSKVPLHMTTNHKLFKRGFIPRPYILDIKPTFHIRHKFEENDFIRRNRVPTRHSGTRKLRINGRPYNAKRSQTIQSKSNLPQQGNEFDFWIRERLGDNDMELLQQNLAEFTKDTSKGTSKIKSLEKSSSSLPQTGNRRSPPTEAKIKVYGGTSKIGAGGEYCVLPFRYNSEVHRNCLPTKDGRKMWCSLSSNYDRDALWAYCDGDIEDPKASSSGSKKHIVAPKNETSSGRIEGNEIKEMLGTVLDSEGASHNEKRKILKGIIEKQNGGEGNANWQGTQQTSDPLFYEMSDTLEDEEEKLLSEKSDWKPSNDMLAKKNGTFILPKVTSEGKEFSDNKIKALFANKHKEDKAKQKTEADKKAMHSEHTIKHILNNYGVKALNDSGWGEDPTVNKFAPDGEEKNKPSDAVTEKITLAPTANDKATENMSMDKLTKTKSFDIMDEEIKERVNKGEEEETAILSQENEVLGHHSGNPTNLENNDSKSMKNKGFVMVAQDTTSHKDQLEADGSGKSFTKNKKLSRLNHNVGFKDTDLTSFKITKGSSGRNNNKGKLSFSRDEDKPRNGHSTKHLLESMQGLSGRQPEPASGLEHSESKALKHSEDTDANGVGDPLNALNDVSTTSFNGLSDNDIKKVANITENENADISYDLLKIDKGNRENRVSDKPGNRGTMVLTPEEMEEVKEKRKQKLKEEKERLSLKMEGEKGSDERMTENQEKVLMKVDEEEKLKDVQKEIDMKAEEQGANDPVKMKEDKKKMSTKLDKNEKGNSLEMGNDKNALKEATKDSEEKQKGDLKKIEESKGLDLSEEVKNKLNEETKKEQEKNRKLTQNQETEGGQKVPSKAEHKQPLGVLKVAQNLLLNAALAANNKQKTAANRTNAFLKEYFMRYGNHTFDKHLKEANPKNGKEKQAASEGSATVDGQPITQSSTNPHDTNRMIKAESPEGDSFCVFPFVYKGKTYFDCTSDDDPKGKLWCSTTPTHNYDKIPKKGYCKLNRRDSILARKTRTTGRSSTSTGRTTAKLEAYTQKYQAMKTALSNAPHMPKKQILTDQKKPCVFPFVYKGESYFDCTTEDDTKSWCSLTKSYDQDLKKGYCSKTTDPQHQSSDTREVDEEEVLALQQQQALSNKLDPSATVADQKLAGAAVTDDEELNNGIVNEAVKQRLAEKMRAKSNPFDKKPQLLDPSNPASLPELQNPLNPLHPTTSITSQPLTQPTLSKPDLLLEAKQPTTLQSVGTTVDEKLHQQQIQERLANNPQAIKEVFTENGGQCVFPFIYNGKSYFDCTSDDDISGKKWCSTKYKNFDLRPEGKGYCVDTTTESGRLLHAQIKMERTKMEVTEQQAQAEKLLPDPLNPESTPEKPIQTEDGKECVFPFYYKGQKYYDCIDIDEPSGKYWCSTVETSVPVNGQSQIAPVKGYCMDERNPGLISSTMPSNTNRLGALNTNPLDPNRPATDPEKMAEQDRLREALDPYKNLKDPLLANASPEEKLKAKIDAEKIRNGEPVTNNPDPEKALQLEQSIQNGNPFERRAIRTETGAPCVFPFIHNSKSYYDCTSDDEPTEKFWCSTTNNFDRDERKGYCVDPRNKNAGGTTSEAQMKLDALRKLQRASNPLNEKISVRHKTLNSVNQPLSRKDYLHLAGEELVSSDSGLKIYGGNSKKSARCAIPFIYNRKSYFSCVNFTNPTRKGESWCATSHNFDKDMKWGLCCTQSKCGKDWAD